MRFLQKLFSVSLIIVTITNHLIGQNNPNRNGYSSETLKSLSKFDSLYSIKNSNKIEQEVEFKMVGEGAFYSEKFKCYVELEEKATNSELIKIVSDLKETIPIRAYAYMAYAYHCDKNKNREVPLNFNFKVSYINGCIGSTVTFNEFKKIVRIRNAYRPYSVSLNPVEYDVIRMENQIRQEQGITLRDTSFFYEAKFIVGTWEVMDSEIKTFNRLIINDSSIYIDNQSDTISFFPYLFINDTVVMMSPLTKEIHKNKIISFNKHQMVLGGIWDWNRKLIYRKIEEKR